jgi:hypothetical protein
MKRKIVVVISLRSFVVGYFTRHFYALAIDPEILGILSAFYIQMPIARHFLSQV